jgi:hypothetical protein
MIDDEVRKLDHLRFFFSTGVQSGIGSAGE